MEAVPRNFPREKGTPVQTMPFGSVGDAQTLFPPVCLKTHWDPTMILRHSLPNQHVSLPMDPRPWTRICMEYTTAGDNEPAPPVPSSVDMPSGGKFYPPTRYLEAIDNESQLRRLDRPLGLCESSQYEPSLKGDMFNASSLLPHRKQPDARFVSELAFPQSLLRDGPYPCREEADLSNMARSTRMFNNATKQDKYNQAFPTKKMQGTKVAPPSQATQQVSELYKNNPLKV